MTYHDLWHRLAARYDEGEAKAIVRWLLEEQCKLSPIDIYSGGVEALSPSLQVGLDAAMVRLEKGEPVQYVLCMAEFCGYRLHVEPGVLIPRPETEELVEWMLHHNAAPATVLDLCTGSGAIATAVSAARPSACIHAADISEAALRVAEQNVRDTATRVTLHRIDILNTAAAIAALPVADCIVSNPPYVRQSEAAGMETTVIAHEPHLALFVPDTDPMVFYRAIGAIAVQRLSPGGSVYVEINSGLASATADIFRSYGFTGIELRRDQFGHDRMIRATFQY